MLLHCHRLGPVGRLVIVGREGVMIGASLGGLDAQLQIGAGGIRQARGATREYDA